MNASSVAYGEVAMKKDQVHTEVESMKRFSALLRRVESFICGVGTVLLFLIALWILLDTVSRTVVGRAVGGSLAATGPVVVIATYLGLSAVEALGGHIRITFFSDALGRRGTYAIDFLISLLGIAVFALISIESFHATARAWQQKWATFALVSVPIWPAYGSVALGSLLMMVRLAMRVVSDTLKLFEGGRRQF